MCSRRNLRHSTHDIFKSLRNLMRNVEICPFKSIPHCSVPHNSQISSTRITFFPGSPTALLFKNLWFPQRHHLVCLRSLHSNSFQCKSSDVPSQNTSPCENQSRGRKGRWLSCTSWQVTSLIRAGETQQQQAVCPSPPA